MEETLSQLCSELQVMRGRTPWLPRAVDIVPCLVQKSDEKMWLVTPCSILHWRNTLPSLCLKSLGLLDTHCVPSPVLAILKNTKRVHRSWFPWLHIFGLVPAPLTSTDGPRSVCFSQEVGETLLLCSDAHTWQEPTSKTMMMLKTVMCLCQKFAKRGLRACAW